MPTADLTSRNPPPLRELLTSHSRLIANISHRPAIISILDPTTQKSTFAIRTTSLLLSLPTPDFSMPYNVIILTSTVIALAFGSIFNLLARRFVGADEVAAGGLLAKLRRVILVLSSGRLRRGPKPKTE